jgi:DNA-binding MarR family transcriptional regulator
MNNHHTARTSEMSRPDQGAVLSWIEAGYLLGGKIEKALEELGLSLAKLKVITYLAESRQSLSLSEIAAKLNCVRSNVTQLVDRLESEGLVRRLYDPSDRRTVRAELTEAGRQKQKAGATALARTESDLAASLSEEDLAALGRLAAAFK